MPTPHPVTSTFLAQCAAVTANPTGDGSVLWYSTQLWPRVSDTAGHPWAFGTGSGITMTGATLVELQSSTANGDGTYTAQGMVRVLNLTNAGSCEPSGPPPPAP